MLQVDSNGSNISESTSCFDAHIFNHKQIGVAIGIIIMLGGLLAAAIGLAGLGNAYGWWSTRSILHLSVTHAWILIGVGGGVALISALGLSLLHCSSKNVLLVNDSAQPSNFSTSSSALLSDNDARLDQRKLIQEELAQWADAVPFEREKRLECATKILNNFDTRDPLLFIIDQGITSLPKAIKQLTHLKVLSLENNQLSTLPEEIGHLMNLERLFLNINQLATLPKGVGQLAKLELLSLDENPLGIVPAEVFNIPNLKYLSLSSTEIQEVPKEVGNLLHLEELDLCHNQISSLPEEINKIINLKNLNISHMQLASVTKEIGKLTNLKRLSLEGNELSSLPLELGNLVNLENLGLNNNKFTAIPWAVCKLFNLQRLDFSENKIISVPPEIGQLERLEKLFLENNKIRELSPEIGQLKNLKMFFLENNKLSALPSQIAHLSNLLNLNLTDNRLTSLPNEVLSLSELCQITIENNLLSLHVLGNLRQEINRNSYRGPTILFSIYEAPLADRPLNELLDELFQAAQMPPLVLTELCKTTNDAEHLANWLSRLSYIGDYQTKRQALGLVIYKAIEKAEKESSFREAFWACLQDAHTTCGDRMALSLIYLDLQYQIDECLKKNDLSKLAYLLMHGTWALDELAKAAENKVRTLKFVDQIEVYLAYPIMLKKELNLPIVLDTMLYFTCSSVTKDDLATAAELVKPVLSDKKMWCEILAKSAVWQKALATRSDYIEIKERKDKELDADVTYTKYPAIERQFLQDLENVTAKILIL